MKSPTIVQSLTRQSLSAEVADSLRAAIVGGELAAGQPLSEPELAKRFQVSRGPVREALIELVRDGLAVEDRRGRTRVVTLESRDYDEILTLRVALEGLAAELAAQRGTDEDWDGLDQNLQQFAAEQDVAKLAELDVQFHERVVLAARHARLRASWESVHWPFLALLTRIYRNYAEHSENGTAKVSQASHREILAALRAGNAKCAGRLTRTHIMHWREWNPVAEAS